MRKPTWLRRGAQLVAGLAGLAALALAALPAQAAPFDGRRNQFADSGFGSVWMRTDTEAVRAGRTWYWGPQPWFDDAEFYREGVNGLRTVQYFDKARMEINNPNDRHVQSGVTNGLLVVEMVSGHLKKGNDPYDFDMRQPAYVPVAGNPKADNPNGPTYAAFAAVATFDNNGFKDQNRLNQRIGTALDASGNLALRPDLANAHPETNIVQYNSITGHNIPQVFWNFMNMQGRVTEGGGIQNRLIVDWMFAMGLPISDAYWTRAQIGAVEQDVLVQLFERRVLTYVPANPAGYQVEMGNVGQHYFQWRYPHLAQPWAAPDPSTELLYASDTITAGQFQVWEYVGGSSISITGNPIYPDRNTGEAVPFSYRRSYDPNRNCLLYDSRRGDGQHRQIYELSLPPPNYSGSDDLLCPARQLTFGDAASQPGSQIYIDHPSNSYNPSYSPDGTQIAFVSDRDGAPQLYLMTAMTDFNIPQRLNFDGCLTQVPTWSPDGRSLYWEQQCSGGKYAVMRGDLQYTEEGLNFLGVTLTNIRALTDQSADNRYPRVSPDGKRVTFTSYRDGNADIYVMNADGSAATRLTSSPADDEAASWNANGSQLAFASNRDGDYEVFRMNADGGDQTQLTYNNVQDRWVVWGQ